MHEIILLVAVFVVGYFVAGLEDRYLFRREPLFFQNILYGVIATILTAIFVHIK